MSDITCRECKQDKFFEEFYTDKSKKSGYQSSCSLKDFIIYLQDNFKEGMTLENYGNCDQCWSIDHSIPISTAKTEEDIISLNHYLNLKPMWHIDNLKKHNKCI